LQQTIKKFFGNKKNIVDFFMIIAVSDKKKLPFTRKMRELSL